MQRIVLTVQGPKPPVVDVIPERAFDDSVTEFHLRSEVMVQRPFGQTRFSQNGRQPGGLESVAVNGAKCGADNAFFLGPAIPVSMFGNGCENKDVKCFPLDFIGKKYDTIEA